MSKRDKLIARFLSRPKDFTYAELITVMGNYGFKEEQGAGSRAWFVNDAGIVFNLHRPHGKKPLKDYQIRDARTALKNAGQI